MSLTQTTRKRARGWQCALTILLAVLLNGCPPPAEQPPNDQQLNGGDVTDQGTADSQSDGTAATDANDDGTATDAADGQSDGSVAGDGSVAKPDRLRVFGTTLGPPNYELRWTYAGDAVAQSFTVYESDAALSAADPATAIATLADSARAASIQLTPGTGQRHILVSAKTDGTSEALSSEYVVDTTLRLAFTVVGRQHCDGRAVYVATPDSGGEPVCVNGATQAKSDARFTEWSPDGRFVATVGDYESEGTFQVYVAASDGSSFSAVSGVLPGSIDVRNVISGLAWSPDATRLAYCVLSAGTGGLVDLCVVTPGASAPTIIARRLRPYVGPSWSTDAEHITYLADPNATGVFAVYSVPADGSAPPTTLGGAFVTGGSVRQPAWSPDDQWLAFLADADVAGQIELYVVPASGGEPTKVSGPMVAGAPGVEPSYAPVWSPDGTRIAYGAFAELADNHHSAYYVVALPPGNSPVKISGSLDVCGAPPPPVWSPDGAHLAFTAATWPECFEAVYVVSLGNEPVLVSGTVAGGMCQSLPYWSPDGTRVAFTSDTGLYVVSADGGGDPVRVSGTGLPWAAFEGPPYWSPDSTWLAFAADSDAYMSTRLWVTLADGSGDRVDISGAAVTSDTRVLDTTVFWSRLSN